MKKFIYTAIALLGILMPISAWAQEPYAVLSDDNTVVTFYSSLVDGAGTTYSSAHTDHTYAHIDGGTANPGYFTEKNAISVEHLYIMGNGTEGEWNTTTEMMFNDSTNAFEYSLDVYGSTWLAFFTQPFSGDWSANRYALGDGSVTPEIGKEYELVLSPNDGCVVISEYGKYLISVTKDLKMTVTKVGDVDKLYIIGNGTEEEWNATTEMTYNTEKGVFEYTLTLENTNSWIAFFTQPFSGDWSANRYALGDGGVTVEVGKEYELVLSPNGGCIVIEGSGKYLISITKNLKMTITKVGDVTVEIKKVVLCGEHNSWNQDDKMAKGEGNVWTYVIDASETESDIQFKLLVNSNNWLGADSYSSVITEAPVGWIKGQTEDDHNFILKNSVTGYKTYSVTATWDSTKENASNGWILKFEGKDVRTNFKAVSFDGPTLSVKGETTLSDAISEVGGKEEVAKTIAAIVWNSTKSITDSELEGINNPNLLIYVANDTLAPTGAKNLIVDGKIKSITLVDVASGNNNFFAPQEFTAENISYIREFKQTTQIDVSRGWETIALPFDVQTITYETRGAIAPFNNNESQYHFWLHQMTDNGMDMATNIEANKPYIISMPNSDVYPEEYNLAGKVTFSATNVTIPVTSPVTLTSPDGKVSMVPAFQTVAKSEEVYVLNVGENRESNPEGSVFERNYRDVSPFEVYSILNNANGSRESRPRYISVSGLFGGNTTGISEIPLKNCEGQSDVVNVYSLDGILLKQGKRDEVIKSLPKGIYIINGKKVVIR